MILIRGTEPVAKDMANAVSAVCQSLHWGKTSERLKRFDASLQNARNFARPEATGSSSVTSVDKMCIVRVTTRVGVLTLPARGNVCPWSDIWQLILCLECL